MYRDNLKNIKGQAWSGGTTKEIYRDREDFHIRISSAVIEAGSSKFSDYSGYRRILKVLEKEVVLTRGSERLNLNRDVTFLFDGHEDIHSENSERVLDFNVIFREDKTRVSFIEVSEGSSLITGDNILIFSLEDNSKTKLGEQSVILDKYDFILLSEEGSKHVELSGNYLIVTWNPTFSLVKD